MRPSGAGLGNLSRGNLSTQELVRSGTCLLRNLSGGMLSGGMLSRGKLSASRFETLAKMVAVFHCISAILRHIIFIWLWWTHCEHLDDIH